MDPHLLKYVVVLAFEMETAIVFPQMLGHYQVVHGTLTVVAAGFCRIDIIGGVLKVDAFGRSETLDRASRGEQDAKLIARSLIPPPARS